MDHPRLYLMFFLALSISMATGCTALADDKPTVTKNEEIDWEKAKSIYKRVQDGEKVSDDDKAYLDHAKAARQKMNALNPQPNNANKPNNAGQNAPTPKATIGLIPLTELKGDARYKGVEGGLYGHGQNRPPEKLLAAALKTSQTITALSADGKPSVDGKIVLVSLGMSNTTGEFSRFKQIADRDPGKSAKLQIVDLAQGGQDAPKWDIDENNNAERSPWTVAAKKLADAKVTPEQVQVIWLKQAIAGQGNFGEFPKHSNLLKTQIESIIARAKRKYPNLKLVYMSSRIYAGNAKSQLNPEPYAYEGAFSVRGVIEDQLAHDSLINPIALWGPYLWADGTTARQADKFQWTPEDFAADGTHPSDTGRQKVAELLLNFFKTDATSKDWFVGR